MSIFYITGIALLAIYWMGVRASGSLINGLSFIFAGAIVFEFLAPMIYYTQNPAMLREIPFSSFVILGLLYIAYFLPLCLGFCRGLSSGNTIEVIERRDPARYLKTNGVILIVLLAGYSLFALFSISAQTAESPFTREFYRMSRLGFGLYYFLGSAASLLIIIIGLFLFRPLFRHLCSLLGIVLLAAYGSKGLVMGALVVIVYYNYLRIHKRIAVKRSILYILVGFVSLSVVFGIYSPWARDNLFGFMIEFSDYTRNTLHEITDWTGFRMGQLTLEDNVYMLIPRALWAIKPDIFGSSILAAYYFPERVALQEGNPSFGRFGTLWADFGWFSFLLLAASGYIWGAVIAKLEMSLKKGAHVGAFIVYLAMIGISLISPGINSMTVIGVNILVGLSLDKFLRLRVKLSVKQDSNAFGKLA